METITNHYLNSNNNNSHHHKLQKGMLIMPKMTLENLQINKSQIILIQIQITIHQVLRRLKQLQHQTLTKKLFKQIMLAILLLILRRVYKMCHQMAVNHNLKMKLIYLMVVILCLPIHP